MTLQTSKLVNSERRSSQETRCDQFANNNNILFLNRNDNVIGAFLLPFGQLLSVACFVFACVLNSLPKRQYDLAASILPA